MADENVPAPAPIRSDDQILTFAAWVPIRKSNYVLDLQKKQKNPIFQISRLRIEQYFQVQDYALWDVIENGNSFKPVAQTTTNADGTSTLLILGPVTTEEKVQNKNDVKARSMLLMALPNEHLMTFNQYKDAKTLFAAIQTRFGGNEATKKTQKTLLKQMYENFSAPSIESLDSIFNRLPKIISQLAILGENISQEDLNLKFLRSLPSEWNTHVVVWRNKPDLDTMSFDDLYNNFKIVEQENMDFMSSPSSTNEVNTAYGVSTANTKVSPASTQVSTTSTQVSTANLSDDTIYAFLASQPNGSQLVYEDLEQIHEDGIKEIDLKWQLVLLIMRTRTFFHKTGRKITINGSDTAGYDKSKVECFNYHKMGHFARECRGPRNQDSTNRNQDSSRRTVNVEETSSQSMVAIDGAGFDWSYMVDDEVPTNMALMAFSDSEFNKSEFNLATYKRGLAYVEEQLVFYKKNKVIFHEQLVVLKRDISYKDSDISMLKRSQITDKSRKGVGFVSYNAIPPPPTRLFSLSNLDLSYSGLKEFQQHEFESYGPKSADCNYHQRERVVSGNNYTRVNYNYSAKKTHPSAHRNMVPRAVLMKTGLRSLNTARPVTTHPKTIVYSARPMSHFSKSAQSTVNAIKASACWVWRPTKLNSASITLEKHRYVNARGRSKVIHKKNSVLFTDTGCFVLSPDFKLADESRVLLKVPRNNNMYRVDMKNIVPKECLTCIVAKATLDESMLWHRRLVDKKVKIIRCDNGTEFKNRVMSEFCKKKGINREFSVARTPQQNSVADKRNRKLIEAARTMLADSKLPTTFWAEAINTACYVQNRVLVVKPHNKTPYELFRGDGPKWLFDIDVLTKSMNYVPVVAGTNSNDLVDGSLFDYSLKNASNDEPQPSSDAEKKDDEGVNKESRIDDQERPENSTQDVNTTGPSINTASTNVNTGSLNINTVSLTVTTALLETTHANFFCDETEIDMSNITTTYLVPSTPNTRIHKDHSLDHVIGDVQSGVQTKRMTKTTNEQGFISVVYEEKTHKDLYTCLFACFLSHEEPKKKLCTEFEKLMHKKFQMSSMGELTFFLGLQDTHKDDGIFISQDKFHVTPKVSHLHDVKRIFRYLKGQLKLGLWYPKDSPFDLEAYTDSDYTGASLDRKFTTGGCQFLGSRLISWQCKKQIVVANSTTEAEYVAATSCCGQVLWIQNQMLDYGYNFMNTKIFIDNESTIYIVKNPVFHSKTKHIKIRHRFIRDSNEKKLIQKKRFHTDQNDAICSQKAFDVW
ncbi:ribonuclease H-like domain-containing protein [Tanacetum coccineum]